MQRSDQEVHHDRTPENRNPPSLQTPGSKADEPLSGSVPSHAAELREGEDDLDPQAAATEAGEEQMPERHPQGDMEETATATAKKTTAQWGAEPNPLAKDKDGLVDRPSQTAPVQEEAAG